MRVLLPLPGPVDDADPAALLAHYAPPALASGATRPHVRANMVVSADGAVVVDGRSEGLSGPADKAVFRVLRALADVVLVGAGTARTEDYGPVRLSDALVAARRARGLAPVPRLAVVSRSLRIARDSRLLSSDVRPIVVTCAAADPAARAALSEVADLLVAGDDDVDLPTALAALATNVGAQHVLTEGGPSLLADLVAAGLLDELCLTVSPQLVGVPTGRATAVPVALPMPSQLTLVGALEDAGSLLLRYSLRATT